MKKPDPKIQSDSMRPLEGRLTGSVFLLIAGGFLVAQLLWAAPLYLWDRAHAIDSLAGQIKNAFISAQNRRPVATLTELSSLIDELTAATPVIGAVVLNDRWRILRKSGVAPNLIPLIKKNTADRYALSSDGCCVDVFLGKDDFGGRYNLAFRANFASAETGLSHSMNAYAVSALVTLVLGSGIATIIVGLWVVLPLGLVARAIDQRTPVEIRPRLTNDLMQRNDILGLIARIVSARALGSAAASDQIGARRGLTHELPFEILLFESDGQLLNANDAALWLFQCRSVNELKEKNLAVFRAAADTEANPVKLVDLLRDGPLDIEGTVQTPDEVIACRIVARPLGRADGDVHNLVACLLPSSGDTGESRAIGQHRIQTLEQNLFVQKLILESCVTLIGIASNDVAAEITNPVRTDLVVEGWYLDASRCGLIDETTEHNVPGQILGDTDTVTSILRHALSVVALRSRAEKPVLSGAGKVLPTGVVEFVFQEVDGPPLSAPGGGVAADPLRDKWKLPHIALIQLLAKYGGKVVETRGKHNANLIRIVMRARNDADVKNAA